MKLRQAQLSDLEEVQTLFVQTIKNTCKSDYDKDQINAWITSVENKERWEDLLINQYFLIAEIDGKIVGFGSLKDGSYLDFMYVHKDYLRQGIAHFLFENLKDESIRLGFDILTSDVSKTARPFFESKGFKVTKENRNIIQGVELINYHMTTEKQTRNE
ncbi:MAG: GNAT family N-acetyltransferase [Bacteroidetes bacterium]|nr:MAG: GNAT family N-acetyltransferase [Bacteroidota bacterium]